MSHTSHYTVTPLYNALPYAFSIPCAKVLERTGLANFIAGVNNPLSGDLAISMSPSSSLRSLLWSDDIPFLRSNNDVLEHLIPTQLISLPHGQQLIEDEPSYSLALCPRFG
jgi:hypothetical protein